jgi:hypothetical protein
MVALDAVTSENSTAVTSRMEAEARLSNWRLFSKPKYKEISILHGPDPKRSSPSPLGDGTDPLTLLDSTHSFMSFSTSSVTHPHKTTSCQTASTRFKPIHLLTLLCWHMIYDSYLDRMCRLPCNPETPECTLPKNKCYVRILSVRSRTLYLCHHQDGWPWL